MRLILIFLFVLTSSAVFPQTCDTLDLRTTERYDKYSTKQFQNRFRQNDENIFEWFDIAQYLRNKNDSSCNQWYKRIVKGLNHAFNTHYGGKTKANRLKLFYIGGFSYYYLGSYEKARQFFISYLSKNPNTCVEFYKSQVDLRLAEQRSEENEIPQYESNLSEFRQKFWDSIPKPLLWINDFEGLFSNNEKDTLNKILRDFEKNTGIEIVIITIDTNYVSRESFDDLIIHFANTWGVGKKDKNNGITIGISRGHRKIRITNGLGIENILSDSKTKYIIDNYFIPKYRDGEYYKGTLDGITEIIFHLRTNFKK